MNSTKGNQVYKSLLFLILILTPLVHAQAPKAKPELIDWALLGGDATVRALDVYSTHHALTQGGHEMFLPNAISHHPPMMAAYSGAVVAVDFWAMRKIERRHPRLAHVLMSIEIAQDGYWAIQNLTIRKAGGIMPEVPR